MTTNQMNNFTTLIKRLEAATSRLEDMATSLEGSGPGSPAADGIATSTASVSSKTASSPLPPPPPVVEPPPRQIEDFDALINKEVKNFVELSEKLGEPAGEQSKAILRAFQAERTYLYIALKAKKPDQQSPDLLSDLRKASDEINNIREANRPSPLFNHLSAVAEGVVSLGWFFEPRPAEFVRESVAGAQFYGDRVLREYKGKALSEWPDMEQPGWSRRNGGPETAPIRFTDASAFPPPPPPPAAGAGGPPPPPPPPASVAAPPKAAPTGDMSSVFEQLNQGSAVTSGLRKVDKSEMTHKNPGLRAGSLVPERADSRTGVTSPTSRGKSPVPSKKPKPESMRAKKPSRKQLDGNKWYIEHYDSPSDIIEIPAQLSHSILISHCNKAIVKINGKANAISIDNCTGLSVIVDSLVSSVDVIKSPKFALQIDGVVPTILLDQVDGASLYLSQESLNTEVFSSKSSNVNIVVPPKEGTDDDSKELPVPEQIRTVIKNGAAVSEIVEHAG
ncbi:adenylyl cyclase-associated protein [Blastomyces gilchristii SLH14081]|uniref:Adenylyl cyclase-associated protein n=1 Tax=Blastomyces gilchristii (strain SLH14081) TaxID=559298 RepID=A0A179UAH3_BLAGS|nr:adenylyl cyclase-associated protein [Blastomyces gilchristii SLH14081]OAT04308.1 adenylyl cyclase-associated protein [Blastomyces gilchristii SLH14081]